MSNRHTQVLKSKVDYRGDVSGLISTLGDVVAFASISPGTIVDISRPNYFASTSHFKHDRTSRICNSRYLNLRAGT